MTRREVDSATIYDNVIGEYDQVLGGNELLYHGDNIKNHTLKHTCI